MKSLLKMAATTLVLFGMAAAPALASDHDRGYNGNDRSHDDGWRKGRDHHRGYDRHRDDRRYREDYRRDRYYRPGPPRVVYYPPHYGRWPSRVIYRPAPPPYWVRGGRYYGSGYAPTYRVDDWGYYGLNAPPRGYYWRRSNAGDFLLVALTTGIIADIVLNH